MTSVVDKVWFNTAEAAAYLGLSTEWVRDVAEAGQLHGVQRCRGGRWRFRREWLDDYAEGRRASALRAAS